jgi:glycerol-3-phosphate dehydrogenase
MAAGKYDFIIVGAGVIGCAIARELARSRCRTLVLEAALDVGEGASKANSSILHTGFDTKPGTLESRLVTEGWQLWQEEADELHLPLQQVGALMLALDDRELLQLEHWWTTAHRNGVTDVERLSPEAVRERYPLAPSCVRGGLLIPRESITCTMTAVIALAEQAAINGVEFLLGARVLGFEPTNGAQRTVLTTRGAFTARWVIDAAGLWADEVAAWAGVNDFHLTPRKGEFLILDKTARTKVPCILLPVPSEVSKGILVTPTVYGNVLLGPTADDISDKHDRTVSRAGLQRARQGALRLAPDLADEPVIATYAGLRAVHASGDYHIEIFPRERLVVAAGIRSTGLSSALAVARFVVQLLRERGESLCTGGPLQPRPRPAWRPGEPRPCTVPERVAECPGYGRVLCLCELVSEEEIRSVFRRPIRPRTLDAVRKRTWATAGRCQGFYCMAAILRVMSEELEQPLPALVKSTEQSWLTCQMAQAVRGCGHDREAVSR